MSFLFRLIWRLKRGCREASAAYLFHKYEVVRDACDAGKLGWRDFRL